MQTYSPENSDFFLGNLFLENYRKLKRAPNAIEKTEFSGK